MPSTTKTNGEVVLEPLDSSGTQFVLFGLQKEQVSFQVFSPKQRTVALTELTQQRKVGKRRFTLTFQVYEAEDRRPFRSGIYEDGGEQNPTAQEQLEIVRRLAEMHEQGTHLAYHGLALDVDRCVISDFNAEVVYNFGTGTITFEERDDVSINLEEIAFEIDALEAALKEARDSELDSIEDTDGDLSADDMLNLTRLYINDKNLTNRGPEYSLQTDAGTLHAYGLGTLPLVIEKNESFTRQVFPDLSPGRTKAPKLYILPLNIARQKARLPLRESASISLTVNLRNLAMWFDLKVVGFNSRWNYEVKVYPIEQVPSVDPREDQLSSPTSQAPTTATVAAGVEPYVDRGNVAHGHERPLADQLSFAFIGKGGQKPNIIGGFLAFGSDHQTPKSDEIDNFALVIADYR